jgi:hypothetical protein
MTITESRELSAAGELAIAIERGGGTMALAGEDIELFLPDDLTHLLPMLQEQKAELVALLRQQNSGPAPLSYPEHVCRLRADGLVPCSREEWESRHGSDAEQVARHEHLCRCGAAGELSTTMTNCKGATVFPCCPKCGSYALHRENGAYECLTCGLAEIREADARKAGARQEAHA